MKRSSSAWGRAVWMLAAMFAATTASGQTTLTEEEVVRAALQSNPDVLVSAANLEAKEAARRQSTSNLLPQAVASYAHIRNGEEVVFQTPDFSTSPPTVTEQVVQPETASTLSFDVTQPLFQGGALWQARKIAGLGVESAEADLAAARSRIALRAREAYYDLVQAQGQLTIAQKTLEQLEENKRVVDRMFQVGSAPRADVLRLDASLAQGQQNLLTSENQLRVAQVALNLVMNREAGGELRADEVVETPAFDMAIADARARAKEQRPELNSIAHQVAAAERATKAAQGALLPSLSLQYHYQREADPGAFSQGEDSWWVGGFARFELPVGLGNVARVQQAKAQAASAARGLESSQNAVLLEVEQAHAAFEIARKGIDLAERQLAAAEESYRQVEVRYRNGEAAQVDLLDAQARLTAARVNLLVTRVGFRRALARLHHAMGDPAFSG